MILFPGAKYVPGSDCGPFVAGPYRGVLHSTEGDSAAGAIASFQSDGYWPHFTVSFEAGVFEAWQHLALDVGAKALEHVGDPETNLQSAIQIECVGHAATSHLWAPVYLAGLAGLMRWIEGQTGIHPISPVKWSGDPNISVRMTAEEWLACNFWVGHEHVPNQEHWDPGAPSLAALLPPTVRVVLNGHPCACWCFLDGGTVWVGVREISKALGVPFLVNGTVVTFGETGHHGLMRTVGDIGYVAAHDLPALATYSPESHTLVVTHV